MPFGSTYTPNIGSATDGLAEEPMVLQVMRTSVSVPTLGDVTEYLT